MGKLVPLNTIDKPNSSLKDGLYASSFEDQITDTKYPVIFVDLTSSDIEAISIKDGIMTITVNSTETYYDMFSDIIINICKTINSVNGSNIAFVLSRKVACIPVLLLNNFSSRSVFDIDIDKSPINLKDFHPDILDNLIDMDDESINYTVKAVTDVDDETVSYTLKDSSNLYVDGLGEIIVQYDVRKFFLLARNLNVSTTKELNNYASTNEVTQFEKRLITENYLNTHDIFYG